MVETDSDQAADVRVAVEQEKAAVLGGFGFVEVSSGGFWKWLGRDFTLMLTGRAPLPRSIHTRFTCVILKLLLVVAVADQSFCPL